MRRPPSPPPPPPSGPWSLLRTDPAAGAFNMAVDEVLMERVRDGGPPTLRLYAWAPPCVSLGRNQPATGHYDPEHLRAAGVDVVRRLTGGRAVLHDEELTYSVIAPARAFGSARRAYHAINQVLVSAVGRLGAAATVHENGAEGSPALSTRPCFAEPAGGEVIAGGRKLIGSAQLCQEGVLLQHGSLPLRRSSVLDRLPDGLAAALDGQPALLDEVRDSPVTWRETAGAIASAWSAAVGPLDPVTLSSADLHRVEDRLARYRASDWTWRR